MGNLRRWSQTATGNASVAGGANTINFVEGQTPGSVNNSAREMMAQIRGIYTPSEWGWVEFSATASVASQTTFKIAGNQTTDWVAPRRWRLKSGSSTRYGTVVSSSYTVETTVTVTVDSGSLSASHSLAALSVVDSNHIPINSTYLTSNSASLVYAPLSSPTFTGTPTLPTGTIGVTQSQGNNTTALATTAYADRANRNLVVNAQTGTTYTAVAADAGKVVTLSNAAAITVTINNSVHTTNDRIDFIQTGAGQVTFAAGAGFTLRSASSRLKITGQYSGATLYFLSASEGILIGDITT